MSNRERRVERAITDFEETKSLLFRRDGTKVYGEAEHQERMGKLVSELHGEVREEIEGAEADATRYEQEVLGLSYTDPTKGLTTTELGRLSAAAPLVREDCESMDPDALVERLRAVSAGSDKLSKVLHARYAANRAEAMDRRMSEAARNGGSVSAEDAASLRALRESVSELETQVEDKDAARGRESAREAAKESRQLAMKLRRRLSEADGSDQRAREEYREYVQSTI